MTYAMSDLHGCYDKYKKMLEKIHFGEDDTLYILGDVVDRGDGGIKILQDMMKRRNIIPLQGNHDYLAHRLLNRINRSGDLHDDKFVEMYQLWMLDGGSPTCEAFMELSSEEQKQILAYMNSFLIYDEVEAGGNKFFLAHTVPEKERMQQFDKLMWAEFIIGEPEYDKEYSPDKYIVTGHTPTGFIDEAYTGKIFKGSRHIAIDCGAVFGHPLGCVCLDTLEEFYVE